MNVHKICVKVASIIMIKHLITMDMYMYMFIVYMYIVCTCRCNIVHPSSTTWLLTACTCRSLHMTTHSQKFTTRTTQQWRKAKQHNKTQSFCKRKLAASHGSQSITDSRQCFYQLSHKGSSASLVK